MVCYDQRDLEIGWYNNIAEYPTVVTKDIPENFDTIAELLATVLGVDGVALGAYVIHQHLIPLVEGVNPVITHPSIGNELITHAPISMTGVMGLDVELEHTHAHHTPLFKADSNVTSILSAIFVLIQFYVFMPRL